jgi:hypothetical protein
MFVSHFERGIIGQVMKKRILKLLLGTQRGADPSFRHKLSAF